MDIYVFYHHDIWVYFPEWLCYKLFYWIKFTALGLYSNVGSVRMWLMFEKIL